MLGLATNVLVRFLVQDDQAQFERAQKLIGRELRTGNGVLISLLVLLETEWVLRSRYSLAKPEILAAFSGLLASAELRFEDEHSVEEALFAWKDSPADFADCLIGARHRALGCRATASLASRQQSCQGLLQPDLLNRRWRNRTISLESESIPQEQRVALPRIHLHPRESAERSGVLLERRHGVAD